MIFLYITILMMNSILNLFSGTNNNLTKPKANQQKKASCGPKQSDIQSYMPSLQQGKKFGKYQGQIVKNLEKKIANMENAENAHSVEGFQTGEQLPEDGLTKQTQQVINRNDFSSQESSIAKLKGQYQNTLKEYEAAQDQVTGTSSDYFERVSSANPFLNKIIQFSTGQLFYVTAQGVAKYIPTMDIATTIDPSRKFTTVDIKWDESYLTPGAKIPTKPNLLVGTQVQPGQRLGMEGENVFVSNVYTKPAAKYVGCCNGQLQTSSGWTNAMTIIGYNTNYEQCKQSAANNGYKYFALTNVDYSKSVGYCSASNDKDKATAYGISIVETGSTVVWSSNTPGEYANTATLTDTGSLSVVNFDGESIFSTPNSTAQPSNYIGCYGDKAVRSMPLFNNSSQQYNL